MDKLFMRVFAVVFVALMLTSALVACGGGEKNIGPHVDNKWDLGKSTKRFKDAYIEDITSSGTKVIDSGTIAGSALGAGTVTSAKIAVANVQASNMFVNSVSLVVAGGTTTNTVAVESGSILIDVRASSGFSNNATITNTSYSGTTFRVDTDASATDRIVDLVFIRP